MYVDENVWKDLHLLEGTNENIKITTPEDFYIFWAIIDVKENSQVFGLIIILNRELL